MTSWWWARVLDAAVLAWWAALVCACAFVLVRWLAAPARDVRLDDDGLDLVDDERATWPPVESDDARRRRLARERDELVHRAVRGGRR